jgi:hypothetical protein
MDYPSDFYQGSPSSMGEGGSNPFRVPQSKTPIIIIGIISLIIIIVYAVTLYIMQKKKAGPFKDYTPPDLLNGVRPGGGMMAAGEFEKRQKALKQALNPTQ